MQLSGALIQYFTAILALIISLRSLPLNSFLKTIQLVLIVSVISSSFNFYYGVYLAQPNPLVGVLYRYGELVCLTFFFLQISKIRVKPHYILVLLLTIALSGFLVDFHSKFSMRSLNAVVFIILSVIIYGKILLELKTQEVTKDSIFWVNSAVFFYFTGTFFLFILTDYLVKNHYDEYRYLWIISNILAVIKNLMFAYAFILWKKYGSDNLVTS